MVINKKANKIETFCFTDSIFVRSFASIIYTNIYLKKILNNICYFHEKQL